MKRAKRRCFCRAGWIFPSLLLFAIMAWGQEEEFTFDADAFTRKAFSLDGYGEFKPSFSWLRQDSSLYKLNFYDQNDRKTLGSGYFALLADLAYRKGLFEAVLEPYLDYTTSPIENDTSASLFQGYFSLKPSVSFSLYAGKKTLRWGKGYAWSPTALVERPKNPNDPDLAREGFWMLTADYTKTFEGALKTLSITPVIIPVSRSVNPDFSPDDGWHFAGKIYLLLLDTDIDLIVLAGENQPPRFGLDFSRNILANWEIHGEIAFFKDLEQTQVDDEGQICKTMFDTQRALLGLRYLTGSETTCILEYYHNGTGFDSFQMNNFYAFVDRAYDRYLAAADDSHLKEAARLPSYSGFSPMRDYLFFRAIQKDAFGVLYFFPAVTVIASLSDGSASLVPEMTYKGFTNWELRLKAFFLTGKSGEEFGEKPNSFRLELRARYFF
jgi:hypothetical protein